MSNDWPYGAWDEEKELVVKIFADDNYTRVDIIDDQAESVAHGTARRDPDDKPDLDIGIELATARAFASYAAKKNRRANGLIKHADEVRVSKRLKKILSVDSNLIDDDYYHPAWNFSSTITPYLPYDTEWKLG